MALSPGSRVGSYEVIAPLGSGGMGEVYLARDVRLNRQVALKTLLAGQAADPELILRLEREAQMLAVLNHPNIAQIYSIEEISGGLALVMELVEGPSLADRIARGPVPFAEAMSIATQLASALEYAHARDVVHRDLKPANIKIASDGTVKVLDFGLAKKQQEAKGIDTAKMTAAGLTQPGTVFGTPGYMAPELLRGQPADVRSDVFAFGVVLFELFTGHHPFLRPSVFEMAEAILNPAPPGWPATPAPIPELVQFVVRKALAKDPSLRYQSIHELRSDLLLSSGAHQPPSAPAHSSGSFPELTATVPLPTSPVTAIGSQTFKPISSAHPAPATSASAPATSPSSTQRWLMIAWTLCFVLIVGGGVAVWLSVRREPPRPTAPAEHTQVTSVGNVRGLAFSPDGRTVAYVAQGADGGDVFVRDVGGGDAIRIWTGDLVVELQWMPDGSQVVVSGIPTSESRVGVFLVPRLGGTARRVPGRGGAHIAVSPDGQAIAMAFQNQTQYPASQAPKGVPNPQGFRIVPTGSGSERFVAMKGFRWLLGLDWARSNNRIAVLTQGDDQSSTVWTVAPDGSDLRELHSDRDLLASVRWSPFGNVLYVIRSRNEAGEVLRLVDESRVTPTTILSGLPWDPADPYQRQSSLSTDGKRLMYVRGFAFANLWRMSTDATPSITAVTQGTSRYGRPRISPNGQWIATTVGTSSKSAVVKIPITGGDAVHLTSGDTLDTNPVWSPDGAQLAFVSVRQNTPRLWLLDANGRSTSEVSGTAVETQIATSIDWTPDNHLVWLLPGGRDYAIRSLASNQEQRLFKDAEIGLPQDLRFSPTGDKVAVWWNRNVAGLWIVDWPARSERLLLAGNHYPAGWSPRGDTVIAFESLGRAVVRIDAVTGKLQPVGAFPIGALEGCSLAPDGGSVVCSLRETKSDAWLVENFDPDAPTPPKSP